MLNRSSILAVSILSLAAVACDDSTAPESGQLTASEAAALALAIDNSSNSALAPQTTAEGASLALLPSDEPSRAAGTRTDEFELDVPCPRGGRAIVSGASVVVLDAEEKFLTIDVEASQAHSGCTFRSGEGVDITIDGTVNLTAERELRDGLARAAQSHSGSLEYATSQGKRGSCAIDLTTEFSLVPGEVSRSILGSVCGHAVDVTTSWTQET